MSNVPPVVPPGADICVNCKSPNTEDHPHKASPTGYVRHCLSCNHQYPIYAPTLASAPHHDPFLAKWWGRQTASAKIAFTSVALGAVVVFTILLIVYETKQAAQAQRDLDRKAKESEIQRGLDARFQQRMQEREKESPTYGYKDWVGNLDYNTPVYSLTQGKMQLAFTVLDPVAERNPEGGYFMLIQYPNGSIELKNRTALITQYKFWVEDPSKR